MGIAHGGACTLQGGASRPMVILLFFVFLHVPSSVRFYAPPVRALSRGMINKRNHCFLLAALQFLRGLPICHKKLLNFSGSTSPTPPEGERSDGPDACV